MPRVLTTWSTSYHLPTYWTLAIRSRRLPAPDLLARPAGGLASLAVARFARWKCAYYFVNVARFARKRI